MAGKLFIQQAQSIIKDQLRRNPALYCADFLASISIGYGFGYAYVASSWLPLQLVAFFVCGFAMFRAGMFIHEIQHMRKGEMVGFKIMWNLLLGIPMLLPSFVYSNHRDHHGSRTYGTEHDGEYIDFESGPMWKIVGYFLMVLIVPPIIVLRFLVLTPASLFFPPLRKWILENASSVSNIGYPRRMLPDENHALWMVMELGCFASVATSTALLVAGIWPWAALPKLYLLSIFVIELNWMRNFTAHRYRPTNGPMSHGEQVEDSINIVGTGWATSLLYPVGMRYHALHHFFPSMPYHNMARAHRLLMERLPEDSRYRVSNRTGFLEVAGGLVRDALANSRASRRTT